MLGKHLAHARSFDCRRDMKYIPLANLITGVLEKQVGRDKSNDEGSIKVHFVKVLMRSPDVTVAEAAAVVPEILMLFYPPPPA